MRAKFIKEAQEFTREGDTLDKSMQELIYREEETDLQLENFLTFHCVRDYDDEQYFVDTYGSEKFDSLTLKEIKDRVDEDFEDWKNENKQFDGGLYIEDNHIGNIHYNLDSADKILTILCIEIFPEFRRKRFGSALVQHVKSLHSDYRYEMGNLTPFGELFQHESSPYEVLDEL